MIDIISINQNDMIAIIKKVRNMMKSERVQIGQDVPLIDKYNISLEEFEAYNTYMEMNHEHLKPIYSKYGSTIDMGLDMDGQIIMHASYDSTGYGIYLELDVSEAIAMAKMILKTYGEEA